MIFLVNVAILSSGRIEVLLGPSVKHVGSVEERRVHNL